MKLKYKDKLGNKQIVKIQSENSFFWNLGLNIFIKIALFRNRKLKKPRQEINVIARTIYQILNDKEPYWLKNKKLVELK